MLALGVCSTAEAGAPKHLGAAYAAYDRGDLAVASRELARAGTLINRDYVLWLRGMVELRRGHYPAAQRAFEGLAKVSGSRFAGEAPWRLADVAWARGDRAAAARSYARLVGRPGAKAHADVGTAMFRIAEARTGNAALAAYRALAIAHPGHPLAERAEAILVERGAPPFTAAERIDRGRNLSDQHLWDQGVAELSLLDPSDLSESLRVRRDYWLGTTLFRRRRRYDDASKLLLGVYKQLDSAEAMFHGARSLSRADHDDLAITWYHKVVAKYPRTRWAEEAQFLAGWLEFHHGKYKKAIPPLEDGLRRYPKSRWVDDTLWFLAMSHYLLGDYAKARPRLERLARYRGRLEGGKAMYWLARIDHKLGDKPAAIRGYTETLQKYPFSWYALLSRARLAALGVQLSPFGHTAKDPVAPRGTKLPSKLDASLVRDDLIRRADELIAAGMSGAAGAELSRGERAFLKKYRRKRGDALAMLLDRYRKANNFYRPWMIGVVRSGGALSGPPRGDAKRWWKHAYPRAFSRLVEKYRKLGNAPDGYLYSIMRKESGFNPQVVSYADAQGLLQMIPPTTRRVAETLGIPYDRGRLYDPEYNIQTGSWYIGHLLAKFKNQIPLGAGSFNSGPRPVMKWIDTYGNREIDELVELVPYTQTREYMKKVTENYARYRYLYHDEIYEQPLVVDKNYVRDQLTY